MYSTKSGSELVLRHKRDTVSSTLDPDTLPLPSEKVVPGPSPGDEAYRKPVRISRRPGEAMKNPWPVIKRARAAKAAPWKPRTSQYRPSVPSYFEGYIELAPQLQDRLERRQILTSMSMTGTSISTPTTVASAAPDERPKSMVDVAMATSKWFDAPIIDDGAVSS